jgi:hypothetical protein
MIQSRQGAVMAQLRRIFYCRINLAIALTANDPPYYRHKPRSGGLPLRFRTNLSTVSPVTTVNTIAKTIAKTKAATLAAVATITS